VFRHWRWVWFRASPTWLERVFVERLGIPHLFRDGDDFETAWENVTAHIDDDDPVLLFLDPAHLEYLDEESRHLPPHVAVLIGYNDETVLLSDGAMARRQGISRSALEAAWSSDRFVSLQNEYLVVTRAARTERGNDAAAAGLRQAATYMLDPLQVKRDARSPGEEGLPALRSFAASLETWSDLSEPDRPVRAALRSIDEHGDGAAFRGLFADSLAELGQRTGLSADLADRMARIADEWRTVARLLGETLEQREPRASEASRTARKPSSKISPANSGASTREILPAQEGAAVDLSAPYLWTSDITSIRASMGGTPGFVQKEQDGKSPEPPHPIAPVSVSRFGAPRTLRGVPCSGCGW
jgi:hypothetical protein